MPAHDKNESIVNQVENQIKSFLQGSDDELESIQGIIETLKQNGRLKGF